MDLNLSVIGVVAEIIELLIRTPVIRYDEVISQLKTRIGDEVRFVFIPAIDFLFLLDILEYDKENDCFILKSEYENSGEVV